MKTYPSIDGHIVNHPIYAFDKLDGSNIRCEWSRKQGLHKFGSRRVLLGEDHPHLGKAQGLVLETYGEDLPRIFVDERFQEVTCFFEFYGPNSFAGVHEQGDTHRVTLFDVNVYKKGMLGPREFLRAFEGRVPIPQMLYRGDPTEDFIQDVKRGTLQGMTFEGVVCKGAPLKNGYPPHAFKVKNLKWIEKVKALYGSDPAKLADLL